LNTPVQISIPVNELLLLFLHCHLLAEHLPQTSFSCKMKPFQTNPQTPQPNEHGLVRGECTHHRLLTNKQFLMSFAERSSKTMNQTSLGSSGGSSIPSRQQRSRLCSLNFASKKKYTSPYLEISWIVSFLFAQLFNW